MHTLAHAVTLSASEPAPWRLGRLAQAFADILDEAQHLDVDLDALSGLHDHEGFLTASWRRLPDPLQSHLVERGWSRQHELACHVEHRLGAAA